MAEKSYRIKEFARRVGSHPNTVRRWEKNGRLNIGTRLPSGHRVYTDEDVQKVLKRDETDSEIIEIKGEIKMLEEKIEQLTKEIQRLISVISIVEDRVNDKARAEASSPATEQPLPPGMSSPLANSPAPAKRQEEEVDIETLRSALITLQGERGAVYTKKLLQKYGARKIGDVKKIYYRDLYKDAIEDTDHE